MYKKSTALQAVCSEFYQVMYIYKLILSGKMRSFLERVFSAGTRLKQVIRFLVCVIGEDISIARG